MSAVHVIHVGVGDPPYHVHAAGCADITRSRTYTRLPASETSVIESYPSLDALVENYYCHHIEESDGHVSEYRGEFKVFPCVTWDGR